MDRGKKIGEVGDGNAGVGGVDSLLCLVYNGGGDG